MSVGPPCQTLAVADQIARAPRHGTVIGWGAGAPVPRPTNVAALAAGARNCLVVRSDGTVSPWGENLNGPMSVPGGLTDVTAVAMGQKHALALRSDGTIVAWGDDPKDSSITAYMGLLDVPPELDGNVTAIAASVTHSLALTRDGTVTAWGWERRAINAVSPMQVPYGLENVVSIAAGGDFSLALQADGTVVAWGGLSGLVPETTWRLDGRATTTVNVHRDPTVGTPATLGGVVAIAAGRSHALALRSNGTVYAWGDNYLGECNVPHDLKDVTAIAAGGGEAAAVSLALKSDGTVVPGDLTARATPGWFPTVLPASSRSTPAPSTHTRSSQMAPSSPSIRPAQGTTRRRHRPPSPTRPRLLLQTTTALPSGRTAP